MIRETIQKLIHGFETILNVQIETSNPERVAKKMRSIGKHITVIGISLAISIFASLYLEQYWYKYSLFLKSVNTGNIFWIMSALIVTILGISIIANGTKEKVMKLTGLKIRKLFLVQVIMQLPYGIILGTILGYISKLLDNNNITWVTNNFYKFTFLNTLVIYSLLSIGLKIILDSFTIFKNSIPEGKDRLTFIVTVFATIISAIALFK